jgi:hypothetical protein
MELTAAVPRLTRSGTPGVERRARRPSAGDLWDRHGSSAYFLACALLGSQTAAVEAVRLAMADLARWGVVGDGEARQRMARTIYRHAQEPAGESSEADRLPPAMVSLRRLARLQRTSLALCVYGGLTHREAAALLDLPPDTVADLITAGLREIGRVCAEDVDAAPCA